jgi:hypothetical protein
MCSTFDCDKTFLFVLLLLFLCCFVSFCIEVASHAAVVLCPLSVVGAGISELKKNPAQYHVLHAKHKIGRGDATCS